MGWHSGDFQARVNLRIAFRIIKAPHRILGRKREGLFLYFLYSYITRHNSFAIVLKYRYPLKKNRAIVMRNNYLLILLALFLCLTHSACNEKSGPSTKNLTVQLTQSPAAPGSGEPNLFASKDGHIYLSWIEDVGEHKVALKFALRENDGWSEPKTVAEGDNWFVNWADFPSLVALDNGTLAVHWLAKSGKGTYAYNVNIAFSKDGGDTWSAPLFPHRDGTETEHGFVSFLPWQNNRLFAVWLDGRNFAESTNDHGDAGKEMTIRFAAIDADGNLSDEAELDSRTCECCQTSAALLPNGAIVAYRDRSENEIRDIYIVRNENGVWSEPQLVFADNWQIQGCPVNGPSIATQGNKVAIAWFATPDQEPQVKVIFSEDGGKTFDAPLQIDDGDPFGRVDVILLPDGAALVSWMEYKGEEGAIKICRVQRDGTKSDSQTIALSGAKRASGFPRMVHNNNEIVFAWTKTGEPSRVLTAAAKLNNQ